MTAKPGVQRQGNLVLKKALRVSVMSPYRTSVMSCDGAQRCAFERLSLIARFSVLLLCESLCPATYFCLVFCLSSQCVFGQVFSSLLSVLLLDSLVHKHEWPSVHSVSCVERFIGLRNHPDALRAMCRWRALSLSSPNWLCSLPIATHSSPRMRALSTHRSAKPSKFVRT